jgi:peptidoglycan-associated lipoprotein
MKIRALILVCASALLCLVQTGCKRSASDVWEDAKTCSRQVGRGVRTLAGQNNVSRQIYSQDDFRGPCDNDFIPLRDEDISQRFASNFSQAPQPSYEPGESGSGLPGIDGFSYPSTAEQIRVFKNIHFDTNEYIIRGSENKQVLANITDYLNRNPNVYVYVEGHCDQKGPAAYNLALGAKRSNAVRNLLVENGINPDRIHTVSYGKERLLIESSTTDAMQQNRRVEFKLYTKSSRGY